MDEGQVRPQVIAFGGEMRLAQVIESLLCLGVEREGEDRWGQIGEWLTAHTSVSGRLLAAKSATRPAVSSGVRVLPSR